MASLSNISAVSARDRHDSVVVPAHVLARKRQQRAELQKHAGNTIMGQALEQEAATS